MIYPVFTFKINKFDVFYTILIHKVMYFYVHMRTKGVGHGQLRGGRGNLGGF